MQLCADEAATACCFLFCHVFRVWCSFQYSRRLSFIDTLHLFPVCYYDILAYSTMRLLNRQPDGTLNLTTHITDIPPYAILSHTWGADEDEVSFTDLIEGAGHDKIGYQKIRYCARQAALDGLEYFWVDTCCIDKSNHIELSTAINSMFQWYKSAARCYVYLSDVDIDSDKPSFGESRWFYRGWTLQELVAPSSVEFFSLQWQRLGDKQSLEGELREITGISVEVLRGQHLSEVSVVERMSWLTNRKTKLPEDMAYCVLGIFDVHMPFNYGEKENAFRRLQEEIDKKWKIQTELPIQLKDYARGTIKHSRISRKF